MTATTSSSSVDSEQPRPAPVPTPRIPGCRRCTHCRPLFHLTSSDQESQRQPRTESGLRNASGSLLSPLGFPLFNGSLFCFPGRRWGHTSLKPRTCGWRLLSWSLLTTLFASPCSAPPSWATGFMASSASLTGTPPALL